jgi:hypothetical protein
MSFIQPDGCPTPPGIQADLATLLLHEACETAGGLARLAQLLEVPAAQLTRWLEGAERAPDEIYRACADIVLLH